MIKQKTINLPTEITKTVTSVINNSLEQKTTNQRSELLKVIPNITINNTLEKKAINPQLEPPQEIKSAISTKYTYSLNKFTTTTGTLTSSINLDQTLTIDRIFIQTIKGIISTSSESVRLNLDKNITKEVLDRMQKAQVQPSDLLTNTTSLVSNLVLSVKEVGDKFYYKLGLINNSSIYKKSASGTEKIISVSVNKPFVIKPNNKLW